MQNIDRVRLIALGKAVATKKFSGAKTEVLPGEYRVDDTFRVAGTIRKGDDYETAATVAVPLKAALALLLKRMGFQRDEAMRILVEVMSEALESKEKGADALCDEFDWIADASEVVADTFAKRLPMLQCAGKVTAKLHVTTVDGHGEEIDLVLE